RQRHASLIDRRLALATAGIGAAYLVFTLLATLGLGVHYAWDLVVAFPFTLAIEAICIPPSAALGPHRRRAILWGVLLTVLWMVILRFGLVLLAFSTVVTVTA